MKHVARAGIAIVLVGAAACAPGQILLPTMPSLPAPVIVDVTASYSHPVGRVILTDLSPDDVEPFEIIKGAAAASIYGNRGCPAIVITTRKRAASKAQKVAPLRAPQPKRARAAAK